MTRTLKRYGPFVAVAVVVVAAIAVFGGGDDSSEDSSGGTLTLDEEELIRSGPMTPARAELEDREDVDFGPACDAETGQLALPSVYAAPCVEPFEGNNGGATAPGVTEDAVKIMAYVPDPALDPIGTSLITGAGANLDPEAVRETLENYVAIYDGIFETYGRTIDFEVFTGTGASDDKDRARADAIAIAEQEPFAVIGGPLQSREVFAEELTARGVLCAPGCGVAQSDQFIEERFPLMWDFGTTSNQASQLAAEAIGNLAGPGPAEMAGDAELREQDRVYAVVHYDTPDGDQTDGFEALESALADHGIELEDDIEFFLDFSRLQENTRTIIAQLENAGVTTVIFYGDFLMPGFLTDEATAQDYSPEWILGPNVLADTALFARDYDQDQWSHGFGIALTGNPGIDEIGDSFMVYEWAYGEEPPSNIYAVIDPGLRAVYTAIHMAGPELTVESFRDGLLRLPARGGGPTRPMLSYGNEDLWSGPDYGSLDDAAIIWWDPEAEGTDEVGQQGLGMYRFANGGQRYTLGEFPESADEAALFDDETSVVELTELPPEDQPPDYPAPEIRN